MVEDLYDFKSHQSKPELIGIRDFSMGGIFFIHFPISLLSFSFPLSKMSLRGSFYFWQGEEIMRNVGFCQSKRGAFLSGKWVAGFLDDLPSWLLLKSCRSVSPVLSVYITAVAPTRFQHLMEEDARTHAHSRSCNTHENGWGRGNVPDTEPRLPLGAPR